MSSIYGQSFSSTNNPWLSPSLSKQAKVKFAGSEDSPAAPPSDDFSDSGHSAAASRIQIDNSISDLAVSEPIPSTTSDSFSSPSQVRQRIPTATNNAERPLIESEDDDSERLRGYGSINNAQSRVETTHPSSNHADTSRTTQPYFKALLLLGCAAMAAAGITYLRTEEESTASSLSLQFLSSFILLAPAVIAGSTLVEFYRRA